jgi:predicted N-acetyltransferase YhbS
MTELALDIRLQSPDDHLAVEHLNERTYGPGRFARTAYRLRERVPPEPDLSFVARVGTLLVGSIHMTRIRIGNASALLLGPLTVEPAFRKHGIGGTLISRALQAARRHGHRLVILVGDEPYYRKSGFVRVPTGRIEMPGPVDPDRLLYCEMVPGAFEGMSGLVLPDLVWAHEMQKQVRAGT